MKFITWNVNGLRACMDKGFFDYVIDAEADFVALQETKASEPFRELDGLGYAVKWNRSNRAGYSGTAVL